MQTKLNEPSALVKINDLGEGAYFWYDEELYLKVIIGTSDTDMIKIASHASVAICFHDETLTLFQFDIKVLPETRNFEIIEERVKQG